MSFCIRAIGCKKVILAKLNASKCSGYTVYHDTIRDALKTIVKSIPDDQAEKTLVTVSASGYHDFPVGTPGYGNVTLSVFISPFME